MTISPGVKKGLIIAALCGGGFFIARAAFGGGNGGVFGGGGNTSPEMPQTPPAADFQGAISETYFGDITNPGMSSNYRGGDMTVQGDTRYLDYNISNRGGDTAILVDYGSPAYGDILVNMVAPSAENYSPCCRSK